MKNVELIYWKQHRLDDNAKKLLFISQNIHPSGSLFIETTNAMSYLLKFHELINTIPLNLQHLLIVRNYSKIWFKKEI